MAAASKTHGAPSLAQVEEELRAAEAYLTTSGVAASSLQVADTAASFVDLPGDAGSAAESDVPECTDNGLGVQARLSPMRDDSFFRRKCKTRPVLSEERRREILAKLSSERQAALQSRSTGTATTLLDRGERGLPLSPDALPSEDREGRYTSPAERRQLIQNLFNTRHTDDDIEVEQHDGQARWNEYGNAQRGEIGLVADPPQRSSSVRSFAGSDGTDDGCNELYYASDILGSAPTDELKPRSAMEMIYEEEPVQGTAFEEKSTNLSSRSIRETGSSHVEGVDEDQAVDLNTTSLFAKLLAHVQQEQNECHDDSGGGSWNTSQSPNAEAVSEESPNHSTQRRLTQERHNLLFGSPSRDQDRSLTEDTDTRHHEATEIEKQRTMPVPTNVSKRIEFLSQPRNQIFAEREKQRLVQEMESLRECTFHPNIRKGASAGEPTTTSGSTGRSSVAGARRSERATRPGTKAFPWLTLSPRRQPTDDEIENCNNGKLASNSEKHAIQRLHLDGTDRYETRERAREALEAQKLRECTFTPKINETSKSMFSMVDYKPIHHRVPDLQRAKVLFAFMGAEYIERIREQLEQEESGPLFKPTINPKSRELASNALATKDTTYSFETRRTTRQSVTDRLAEDADALAEKRLATQEYYDVLEQQPFAPKISESSSKIVEHKPEFKMDFVTRQTYFQSRDQEKLEALEGYSDMDYARGERLTFKPDIGNADDVLKQLRPDRGVENSEQQLYRLTYSDRKKSELKKQRLRNEQYAQYTFKPQINPVSKVLGRSSTIDELSHPVRDLQQTPSMSRDSPPQDRPCTAASSSRAELKQYFANKRFRSRVALEMELADKAECTFHPTLISSQKKEGSCSASKVYSRERRTKPLEWKSENLLHLIEAERQKKLEEIEAKRNAQELRELEECTFRPNIRKPGTNGTRKKATTGENPHTSFSRRPRVAEATEDNPSPKPVIVRGLGRFLELRNLARKQQAEQKEREQKVFAPNTAYEPRSYTVPRPFKLSESSKDSIRRRLQVREEMRAKERKECTFHPQTVASQNRRLLENMLDS